MHNLCLIEYYHLIVQADILVNNWQQETRNCPKNAVEVDSPQAFF